ncbi:glycosyltransferase [Pedobacter metabolipauper]|uniref:Glycosyl transferase family 2 n=1 Tax=Pedobacter metabolipauper TaxID=425513 RepID=A0A4R6SUH0_9SPHI|nr:glycosyltransferase [Pedobacter metabolipauper]TDQ09360.1 glycosyl transferase family 2 [Pedobacter metabolipauper]
MPKESKFITVVIVTYNVEEILQPCLDSIYNQTFKNISIVIIDGKSNDGTLRILEQNNKKIDYWKSEKDTGIYDAMNKALPHINTPWVYFLGADDILLSGFSTFITELKDLSTIYYANVLYKGRKCSGNISPYRQAKLGIFHQSIIYPSSVFKKYTYNTKYTIAADYALNMQLHKDPNYTFKYLDYTIADYNDTGASAIVKDLPFEADKTKMILRNFGLSIWLRYIFRQAKAIRSKKEL